MYEFRLPFVNNLDWPPQDDFRLRREGLNIDIGGLDSSTFIDCRASTTHPQVSSTCWHSLQDHQMIESDGVRCLSHIDANVIEGIV